MLKFLKDYILILAFIFLPQLKIGGLIIPTFYLFLVWGIYQTIRSRKLFFPSLLIFIYPIQFIFLCFSNVYNGYIEFSLLKEMILFPFYYAAGFSIISKILIRESEIYLIRILAYAIITNSLIILILVFFKDLNPLFHDFIHITEKSRKYIYDVPLSLRHSGLGVSGFSYLSVKTVCVFFIILLYNSQKNTISKVLVYLTSLITLISLIFVARTGLFLGVFGLLVYLFSNDKRLLLSLIFFTLIGSGIIWNQYLSMNEGDLRFAIDRSFDLFLSDESKSDGSLNVLKSEADSFKLNSLMLGDQNYGRDKGLISDIGYISFLKGGGIIGLIILTMHWFKIISKTFMNNKDWIRKGLLFISILLLLFNSKELVFYGHGYMQAMIILLILYEQKRHNNYYGSL